MNVTQGDYARFNSYTYLEVYDDIQEKAEKKYRDEATAHEKTREEKIESEMKAAEESSRKDREIEILSARVKEYEQKENKEKEEKFNKKAKKWGWLVTLPLFGVPYLVILTVIEIVKTQFVTVSWQSFFGIAGSLTASAIVVSLFALLKKKCFEKVRSFLEKRRTKQTDQG